ncbi:hypothetical protein TNCV_1107321 [Trichonephila clavipes]|nr:hypothetical protein TNCV_1107321 [Trichonephila clavipes]
MCGHLFSQVWGGSRTCKQANAENLTRDNKEAGDEIILAGEKTTGIDLLNRLCVGTCSCSAGGDAAES